MFKIMIRADGCKRVVVLLVIEVEWLLIQNYCVYFEAGAIVQMPTYLFRHALMDSSVGSSGKSFCYWTLL